MGRRMFLNLFRGELVGLSAVEELGTLYHIHPPLHSLPRDYSPGEAVKGTL